MKCFKEFGTPLVLDGCCEEHPDIAVEVDENALKNVDEIEPEVLLPKEIQDATNPETMEAPVLSLHLRCLSHTLSLIATTDVQKAVTGKLHGSFAKMNKLWTLAGKASKAGVVKKHLGVMLRIPTVTRWNSLWDAINLVLENKEKIGGLMEELNLPELTTFDFTVFEEYSRVLTPIAIALDRLQGEKDCHYSIVLPTIVKVYRDLLDISDSSVIHCAKLLKYAQQGLESRFSDYLDFNERNDSVKVAILATVSDPRFKLRFLNASDRTNKPKNAEICRR